MVLNKRSRKTPDRNFSVLSVLIKLAFCFPLLAKSQVYAQEVRFLPDAPATPDKIDFNSDFLHGENIDISRFSQGNITLPGVYEVTTNLNGKARGRLKLAFVLEDGHFNAQPCFNQGQLRQLGIIPDEMRAQRLTRIQPDGADKCYVLSRWVEGAVSQYNSGDFELNLQVPQLYVSYRSDDYVDPSLWEAGETVGFIDYAANAWQVSRGIGKGSRNHTGSNTGNLAATAGINLGEWRFRKRTNFGWSSQRPAFTQNIYAYAQRDITPLNAVLTLGETSSNGTLFEGYRLRGAVLQTDERMLPTEMRNYSPILRGVAETNAKITVTQRGQTLYETIVPPGPFAITDLGAMGYGGDLVMTITEADGRTRQQLIPFSAPPMLLREGASRFSVSAGQLDEQGIQSHYDVFQAIYHRGVMNFWTMYGGALIGEYYKAFGIGQAFNTPVGGLSFDMINARSVLPGNILTLGNSYQISYSNYLNQTNTNITLAAYRYSSKGYYTFHETALAREFSTGKEQNGFSYINYRTQNRFTASINQRLDENKTLWFSGSLSSYWNDQPNSRQYSLSFSHSLDKFSYAITGSRSRAGNGRDENIMQLSLNVPIGGTYTNKPLFSSLYSSVSHSNLSGTQFQTHANGNQGEGGELTYGVGVSTGASGSSKSVDGNIQYQTSLGQLGMSATFNNTNTQLSGSMSGSVVAHPGGVTLGPALYDAPFAIVEAKGAAGAGLFNGRGAKVDRFGYAIKPSLTSYRENTVQLNAKGLPHTVDVLENEKRIYPRQGAAIPVRMQTITGTPMILTLRDGENNYLPIGTELTDTEGTSLSVVGQGGQAFVRGWDPTKGPLLSTAVQGEKLKCVAKDASSVKQADSDVLSLVKLEAVCLRN